MGEAQLVERRSSDGGRNWSEPKIMYHRKGTNIMSASLTFLSNSTPALLFLRRNPQVPYRLIDVMMMTAKDVLGEEWFTPKQINTEFVIFQLSCLFQRIQQAGYVKTIWRGGDCFLQQVESYLTFRRSL